MFPSHDRNCISENKEPVPAGDIDVYCFDEYEYRKAREILIHMKDYTQKLVTSRAVTYAPKEGTVGKHIQLIQPVVDGRMITMGLVREVLDNFDFTVARAAIFWNGNEWGAMADEDFQEHEKKNKLKIKNIHCPVGTMNRVTKYIRKGYSINQLELVKLFLDWETRDQGYKSAIAEGAMRLMQEDEEITIKEINASYDLIGGVD